MTKNKTKYYIVCFKDRNKYGFTIEKQDLKTAFYCLNDCLNSGLYQEIVFRVYKSDKCGFSSDAPVLSWNDRENALKMNCNLTARGIKAYKHYLTRFINYIKSYGYTPKYTIAEV